MAQIILTMDIEVLSDRNATVAQTYLASDCAGWPLATATGASKREQGDIYDQGIAIDLAVGRALEKMGRKLRQRANANVKAACKAKGEDER